MHAYQTDVRTHTWHFRCLLHYEHYVCQQIVSILWCVQLAASDPVCMHAWVHLSVGGWMHHHVLSAKLFLYCLPLSLSHSKNSFLHSPDLSASLALEDVSSVSARTKGRTRVIHVTHLPLGPAVAVTTLSYEFTPETMGWYAPSVVCRNAETANVQEFFE